MRSISQLNEHPKACLILAEFLANEQLDFVFVFLFFKLNCSQTIHIVCEQTICIVCEQTMHIEIPLQTFH